MLFRPAQPHSTLRASAPRGVRQRYQFLKRASVARARLRDLPSRCPLRPAAAYRTANFGRERCWRLKKWSPRATRAAPIDFYARFWHQKHNLAVNMIAILPPIGQIEVLSPHPKYLYLFAWRARARKGRAYGVERHATAAERHATTKIHRAAPSARQTRRNARGEEARDKEKPLLTAQRRRPQINQARTTPPAATRPASARKSV